MSEAGARLSRELRMGGGELLRNRRKIVGLSLLAAGAMMPISLYQMGIIKHLPEPPIPGLDADTIDASAEAYDILMTPDAVLGVASFGITASLAAMGGKDRAKDQPLIPLAMTAKVVVDAAFAIKLTIDQWTKHRAFCSWCLLGAAANFATVPLVIPETRAAWRRLRG